jgi:hypothetical protein
MARHGPAQRGASKKPSGEAVVTTPPPPERASSLSSPTLNHTSSPRNQIQPNPTRRQEKGSERIHQHRGDRSGCESPPGPKICSLRSALAAARREEGDGRLEEGTGEGRGGRGVGVRACVRCAVVCAGGPARASGSRDSAAAAGAAVLWNGIPGNPKPRRTLFVVPPGSRCSVCL